MQSEAMHCEYIGFWTIILAASMWRFEAFPSLSVKENRTYGHHFLRA